MCIRDSYNTPVRVGPSSVRPKRDCQYLGVTLDSKLTWRPHIKRTTTIVRTRLRSLRTLSRLNHCSSDLLGRIYTTCIRPILTYAHPVLLTASPAYLDLHRITERRALRLIYRRPRLTKTSNAALYALNTRFPDLDSFLVKLNWKYSRTASRRNSIQTIVPSINRNTRNTSRPSYLLNRLLAIANGPPPRLQPRRRQRHRPA